MFRKRKTLNLKEMEMSALLKIFVGVLHLTHLVASEAYYNNYVLSNEAHSNQLNTKSDCMNWCIGNISCTAVSVCLGLSNKVNCRYSFCGNIQLFSIGSCDTIVLADINTIDGFNVPKATNEWILTDVCGGASYANTGLNFQPAITTESITSYWPTVSSLFGNALTIKDSVFTAANVSMQINGSFSIFFRLRFSANLLNGTTYTFFTFRYPLLANNFQLYLLNGNLTLLYSTNAVTYTAFTTTDLAPRMWHRIQLTFQFQTRQLIVFANHEEILSAKLPDALIISTSLPALSGGFSLKASGDNATASIYCFKIYDLVLTPGEFSSVDKSCYSGKISMQDKGYVKYTASGYFLPSANVKTLRVLVVGGGAGGGCGNGAGGGAGFVSYGVLNASSSKNTLVSVGGGGVGAVFRNPNCSFTPTSAFESFFGNFIHAKGGTAPSFFNVTVYQDDSGGSGGSGGGAGTTNCNICLSGSGGSAGSWGTSGNTSYKGGSGQGFNLSEGFSIFKFTKISAGVGVPGKLGTSVNSFGGGGAGGVLLNGVGPIAGGGSCCTNDPASCGFGGATGFGSSGTGSCNNGSNLAMSGHGVAGLVYIEFF